MLAHAMPTHRRSRPAPHDTDSSLDDVYCRYRPFIRETLRRLSVSDADAEDVTQEVFLVLLRKVEELDTGRSLRSWLYQVTRRLAGRQRRTLQRHARKRGLCWELESDIDPEQSVARTEALEALQEFLDGLDPDSCAVFMLSEIESLPAPEIARKLGLNVNTTYSRIRSLRMRLAQAMASRRDERQRSHWMAALLLGDPKRVLRWAIAFRTATRARILLVAGIALLLALAWMGRGRSSPDASPPGPSLAISDGERSLRSEDAAQQKGPPLPSTRLTGIVVDEDEKPIEGAKVCAARDSLGAPFDQPSNYPVASTTAHSIRCTTTDRLGRFRLAAVPTGRLVLHAAANGFLPQRYHDQETATPLSLVEGESRSDLRMVLRSGGVPLQVVVEDLYGGPIMGAVVTLLQARAIHPGAFTRDVGGSASWISDEHGRVEIWVPAGVLALHAEASGYARSLRLATAPGPEVSLFLGAEATLGGKVVDAEGGHAVGDATVRATSFLHNVGTVTRTDDDGRFHIEGLGPGEYTIEAQTPDRIGRATEVIPLGIGDSYDNLVLGLRSALAVEGRVVDQGTQDPCTRGRVELTHVTTLRQTLDWNGEVRILGILPNTSYDVLVHCEGREVSHDTLEVGASAPERQIWEVSDGLTMTGRVVDANERGLAGWTVSAAPPPWFNADLPGLQMATSGADGRFRLTGLSSQRYQVLAHGPDHAATPPVDLELSNQDLEDVVLVAEQSSTLRGRVIDGAQRHPMAGARIRAIRDPERRGDVLHKATAASDGTFTFENLPNGGYRVWTIAGGSHEDEVPAEGASVRTTEVPIEDELTLVLEAPRVISGRVVDDDGPVGDALIQVHREAKARPGSPPPVDPDWNPMRAPAVTDADGRFEVRGVSPGSHTLIAHRPGGGKAVRSGVQAGASVIMVLTQSASIEGSIQSGDVPAGGQTQLYVGGLDNNHYQVLMVDQADARWRILGLRPGRYRVEAHAPRGHGHVEVSVQEGQEKRDVVLTLAPFTKVRGRLIDSAGKPVGNKRVIVFQYDGSPPRTVPFDRVFTSAADGSFEGLAAPGQVAVYADSPWTEPLLVTEVDGQAVVQLGSVTVPDPR